MATYAVDPALNADAVAALRSVTGKLEASLQALTASAERFKAANAGVAIESYDAAQLQWNKGMSEMRDALNRMGINLGRITDNYVDTDARGAGLF